MDRSSLDTHVYAPTLELGSYGPPPVSPDNSPRRPPAHERTLSVSSSTAGVGSRRSRARAFSFLQAEPESPIYDVAEEDAAFNESAYQSALAPAADISTGANESTDETAYAREGRMKDTFQPITKLEKTWMSASAIAVLALVSLALTFIVSAATG